MGVFFKRSRADNSAVGGLILPNFKLVRDIIVVLQTCKNEEDPIKNESANKIICHFFRRSRTANSEVSSGILPKFELMNAFIVVLFTCKN